MLYNNIFTPVSWLSLFLCVYSVCLCLQKCVKCVLSWVITESHVDSHALLTPSQIWFVMWSSWERQEKLFHTSLQPEGQLSQHLQLSPPDMTACVSHIESTSRRRRHRLLDMDSHANILDFLMPRCASKSFLELLFTENFRIECIMHDISPLTKLTWQSHSLDLPVSLHRLCVTFCQFFKSWAFGARLSLNGICVSESRYTDYKTSTTRLENES